MGLFKWQKAPQEPVTCPICRQSVADPLASDHWLSHVVDTGRKHGADRVFKWECSCGRPLLEWYARDVAEDALRYHLKRAHGIAVLPSDLLMMMDSLPTSREIRGSLS